jgi:hypothetical protein
MTNEPQPTDSGQSPPSTAGPAAEPPAKAPPPAASATPAEDAPGSPVTKVPFALQRGERALRTLKRHWMWLWPMTLFFAGMAIIPIVVALWLLDLINVRDNIGGWYWIPAGLWFLYWLVRAFLNFYRYDNDMWVITNQRIIDSFKPHPFSQTISTADLVNITDMTVQKHGIFETMLKYGDVVCQTAGSGAKSEFRMIGVPNPDDVQLFIDAERDRERLGGSR